MPPAAVVWMVRQARTTQALRSLGSLWGQRRRTKLAELSPTLPQASSTKGVSRMAGYFVRFSCSFVALTTPARSALAALALMARMVGVTTAMSSQLSSGPPSGHH